MSFTLDAFILSLIFGVSPALGGSVLTAVIVCLWSNTGFLEHFATCSWNERWEQMFSMPQAGGSRFITLCFFDSSAF